MTPDDIRLVSKFGADLAQAISQMASIALALVAHCKDEAVRDLAVVAIKTVSEKLTEDLARFDASAVPTGELDA